MLALSLKPLVAACWFYAVCCQRELPNLDVTEFCSCLKVDSFVCVLYGKAEAAANMLPMMIPP